MTFEVALGGIEGAKSEVLIWKRVWFEKNKFLHISLSGGFNQEERMKEDDGKNWDLRVQILV